jgi:tRNA (guanine37-N1)-methyltransferase
MQAHLILIAGHYKGIDQRVRDALVTCELSIGDYVLSGGELPALVVVDAVARLLPGVLGDASSALTDSFQDDLLDAPVYTRPETYRGRSVPDVLLSGNHARIAAWRDEQRLQKTRERRPDLLYDDSDAS